MKITVKKDFRGIKAGTVYDFSAIKKINFLTIVGENGCGKSSILQAFRGTVNEPDAKSYYRPDHVKLAANIEVKHDYERVLFFDAIKDSGTDFVNAADASNYIEMGGWSANRLSHGQGTLMYIQKFMEDNKSKFVPDKTLIVFDEIDHGLSLANQSKFVNFILNLTVIHKCHILIVSHNPFFITQSVIVYDFNKCEISDSVRYIKQITGFWVVDKDALDILLERPKEGEVTKPPKKQSKKKKNEKN